MFEEAGATQAFMIDRMPGMMAKFCTFCDSARAELLAIEAASLADASAVREMNMALIFQVRLVPSVSNLLLHGLHVMGVSIMMAGTTRHLQWLNMFHSLLAIQVAKVRDENMHKLLRRSHSSSQKEQQH